VRSGKVHPDIVVRAYTTSTEILVEAPRVCHAPATVRIDLTAGGEYVGPSEYDALASRLAPAIVGFDLASATETHIAQLACSVEAEPAQIADRVSAAVLAASTGVAPAILYALLRAGFPSTRRELLRSAPASLRGALEIAVDRNVIPTDTSVDDAITALRAATVAMAFDTPSETATGNLGDLLATVLPTRGVQEEFLDRYLAHSGRIEDFWTGLAAETSFSSSGTIPALQFALQLGTLSHFHFPLIAELQARKAASTLGSVRDLATYGESDWIDVIETVNDGHAVGYPADIPGADAAAKKANYARVLKRTMEIAFPSLAMAADITRAGGTGSSDLAAFFAANPDFLIGKVRLGAYAVAHPSAFDGLSDPTGTRAQLERIERLFQIAPRYADVKRLLDDGFSSAHVIRSFGRSAFVAKYHEALGGSDEAGLLFDRAESVTYQALALHTKYAPPLNPRSAFVLPDPASPSTSAAPKTAEFPSLFGAADACACEHCLSVLSPAAYFVDLLEFLGKHPSTLTKDEATKWSAADVLLGRVTGDPPSFPGRPDLRSILLTCDNSDIPVPYVDLVNEILEHAVASTLAGPDPVYPEHIATSGTAADLAALQAILPGEEGAHAAAYATLATAVYPFALPFHFWANEARAYLTHLGVPRYALMQTLQRGGSVPGVEAIAGERLGLSPLERRIIAGSLPPEDAPSLAELWGLTGSQTTADLTGVALFLDRSGLTFDELVELLDTSFIRRFGATPTLVAAPGSDGCDIAHLSISGLDIAPLDTAWEAIHRFLRLQRRTGYSIRELDAFFTSSTTPLDEAFLQGLAAVERFRGDEGVPAAVLASWFGDMDRRRRDGGNTASFYEQVFQSRAVKNPPDPAFDNGGDSSFIADHAAVIRGALHLSASDLALLTDSAVSLVELGVSSEFGDTAPALTFANLCKLHRIVTFSRALGVSIKDWLILKRLAHITTPFTPEGIARFVDVIARVQRAGQKPADLLYLFAGFTAPSTTLAVDDATIDELIDALFEAEVKLHATSADADAQDNLIQQTLAAALGLEMRTTGLLLRSVLTPDGTMGTSLIEAFRLTVTVPFPDDPTLGGTARFAQRSAYRHLHKVTGMVKKLGMSASELFRFNVDEPEGQRVFAFDALPRTPSIPSVDLFDAWFQMIDLWALKPTLRGGKDVLLALFPSPGTTLAAEDAAAATGWPLADLTALLDETSGLSLSFGGAQSTATTLLRLRDAFAALKRLGVSAANALRWIDTSVPLPGDEAPPLTAELVAAEIVQTARAKYDEGQWAALGPVLRNPLRDAQREAMVTYLVAAYGYKDGNELFGRLLVDAEVCSCQLTSRLKQAIGSVQTFVQRALLGLLPDVPLSAEAANEWVWRKNYRLWEANRRVFLYPENWLDPELRVGKSPFFKALEGELRQRELTSDTAELAIQHYLEKLVEVDRLEVVAMAHQVEADDADHPALDLLHVIGRTTLAPNKYFYRRRVGNSYWTPWESMEVDIEGNHLLLAVINNRPHLFWPLIQEKPDAKQPHAEPDQSGPPARKHLEIQLAWSEYRSGAWVAKRTSTGAVVTISPVVRRYWLSFVLERHDSPPGPSKYSVACLFNPVQTSPLYPKLIRLGSFSFDACGTLVGNNRGHVFSPLVTFAPVYSKPYPDDVVALSRPSPSTMVYQYAKEYKTETEIVEADSPADVLAEGTSADHPLTLPIVFDGEPELHPVLGKTPGTFRVLSPHVIGATSKDLEVEADVLFYSDAHVTFFAELETVETVTWGVGQQIQPGLGFQFDVFGSGPFGSEIQVWAKSTPPEVNIPNIDITRGYRFSPFYHPYACTFLSELNRSGVAGLLDRSRQLFPLQSRARDFFATGYQPNEDYTKKDYPRDEVDFSISGAYSLYNWELFFHVPFLIASRLMQNQRFGEAQKWLHYIFDPTPGTAGSAPGRFWKFVPFIENTSLSSIQEEIETLAEEAQGTSTRLLGSILGLSTTKSKEARDFEAQVAAWLSNPFDPHLLARMRPLAYQKAVVMKYVENLLAWGDQLFRRDTIESINEATQLYILAADLLGPRPRRVRRPGQESEARTYEELSTLGLNAFSDAFIAAESLASPRLTHAQAKGKFTGLRREPPPLMGTLYFCVPGDSALEELWDTVADRLFKLRHCMNIEGVAQQLPLFEPPIDPALLVQAIASGVDLQSALADLEAPRSHYRFSVLYGKAMELCAGVTAFGGALLAALEKRDAEGLAQLRSAQEIEMLGLMREVKERQIKEAESSLAGLEKALEVTRIRRDHYAGLQRISSAERDALNLGFDGMVVGGVAQGLAVGLQAAHIIPFATVGAAGALASPLALTSFGGQNLGASIQGASQALSMAAGLLHEQAARTSTYAGYERRKEDWDLQVSLATKEVEQIGKQIAAARIRLAITQRELVNHDKQVEHAKTAGAYLRDKFTNEALYDWMITRIATVYFQSYQLAYDMAKRAEKCFRFELGLKTSKFVTFGYWDNLQQGLLSGERLQHDLRRMEVAYLEQNARELEITKHISLAQLDPAQLMTLRETGACVIDLPETLFDLDYPGQYLRRTRSVSLTIPAVSGPYTGVSCTLRLVANTVRLRAGLNGGNYGPVTEDDDRFRKETGGTEAVVMSSAQNDSGLFEVSLRDERYLPFEGTGAVSTWELALPKGNNAFDVSAIADVVLHLRYTARSGGDAMREAATNATFTGVIGPRMRKGKRLFSAREDFPEAWAAFMNPPADQASQILSFPLDASLFPYAAGNEAIKPTSATVYARWNGPTRYGTAAAEPKPLVLTVTAPELQSGDTPVSLDPFYVSGLAASSTDLGKATVVPTAQVLSTWTLSVSSAQIAAIESGLFSPPIVEPDTSTHRLNETLQDVWLLVDYEQHLPTWA
jgi:hypothetical protein